MYQNNFNFITNTNQIEINRRNLDNKIKEFEEVLQKTPEYFISKQILSSNFPNFQKNNFNFYKEENYKNYSFNEKQKIFDTLINEFNSLQNLKEKDFNFNQNFIYKNFSKFQEKNKNLKNGLNVESNLTGNQKNEKTGKNFAAKFSSNNKNPFSVENKNLKNLKIKSISSLNIKKEEEENFLNKKTERKNDENSFEKIPQNLQLQNPIKLIDNKFGNKKTLKNRKLVFSMKHNSEIKKTLGPNIYEEKFYGKEKSFRINLPNELPEEKSIQDKEKISLKKKEIKEMINKGEFKVEDYSKEKDIKINYRIQKGNHSGTYFKIQQKEIKRNKEKVFSKTNLGRSRKSNFRGVSKNGNQWQVLIMIKNFKRYVGSYDNEEDAAKAYDKVAIYYHRTKAKTNYFYTKEEILNILNEKPLI